MLTIRHLIDVYAGTDTMLDLQQLVYSGDTQADVDPEPCSQPIFLCSKASAIINGNG